MSPSIEEWLAAMKKLADDALGYLKVPIVQQPQPSILDWINQQMQQAAGQAGASTVLGPDVYLPPYVPPIVGDIYEGATTIYKEMTQIPALIPEWDPFAGLREEAAETRKTVLIIGALLAFAMVMRK